MLILTGTAPASARTTDDYLAAAQQYLAKGNLRAAEIELRNALRQAPNDAGLHVRLATLYLRIGNNIGAEREAKAAGTLGAKEADYLPVLIDALLRQRKFGELLKTIPAGERASSAEGLVRQGRGLAHLGLQNRDEALANLREAVRLNPDALSAKLALARVLLSARRVDEAEPLVDEALASDPSSVDALQVKGVILRSRGDLDGALRTLGKALEIDPKNLPTHLARAELYLLRKDAENALKDLAPILAAAPDNPPANYLKALELAQRNEFAAANQLLNKISASFPQMIEGFYLQGAVQFKLGQLEQAESNLTKYIARASDNAKALRLMAEIALRRGAASRAVDYLKQLHEKTKPDVTTSTLLGNAYMAQRKPELAMAQFEAAAKLAPDNPAAETRLALSRINLGQREQGLAELEAVFASDAGTAVAGPVLVLTALRAGQVDKADEVAQALVKKEASNPLYHTLLGLVRLVQRDYKAAETALRTALARDPEFLPATQNLARVYLTTGRRDEAQKAYEALVARKPDDVVARLALADLAIMDREWKRAADEINHARSAAPNDPRPGIKLIDLYLAQQNHRDAQSIAGELLALFTNNPDVLDAQGRVQIAAGDFVGAAGTYRRAFEASPNSPTIRSRYLAALRAAKDFKTMREVLAAAIAREPDNTDIKAELVRVEAESGGADSGIAKAREFAARDPKNPAYDLLSAELYEKSDRHSDAVALLEKRQREEPSQAVLLMLARLHLLGGEGDKAVSLLQARLNQEPRDVAARLALAAHYMQQQQYQRAREEYERVVADSPTSAMALNNLAWLLQREGNLAKARELAERAIAIAPQNAAIADTLGWIMTAQGDAEAALRYLMSAGAVSRDPEIQYHIAVALKRAGREPEARTVLETLLKSDTPFQSKVDARKLFDELTRG